MSSLCSSNFYYSFSKFDMVTYITSCQGLMPRRTECKHILKETAWNFYKEGYVCKFPRGGGGKTILSHLIRLNGIHVNNIFPWKTKYEFNKNYVTKWQMHPKTRYFKKGWYQRSRSSLEGQGHSNPKTVCDTPPPQDVSTFLPKFVIPTFF